MSFFSGFGSALKGIGKGAENWAKGTDLYKELSGKRQLRINPWAGATSDHGAPPSQSRTPRPGTITPGSQDT